MLDSMRRLIPRQYEKSTITIVGECHEVLGAFVKGQFLVMFLLGVVYAVGLQVIGLEVGIIIGMIAGLASIIPYLGFCGWYYFGNCGLFIPIWFGLVHLALSTGCFMVGQAIEGYILQPFLLGDKIGLSPVG